MLAWWLRDAGKGEIIAVATFVVDLESVAVIGENQAVRKIIEDSRNGRRCAVIDDGENCADRYGSSPVIKVGKLRAALDRDAIGYHLADRQPPAQPDIKEAVGRKRETALERDGA